MKGLLCAALFCDLLIFQNDPAILVVFSNPVLLLRKPGLVVVRQRAPRHSDGGGTGWHLGFQATSSPRPPQTSEPETWACTFP